MGSDGEVTQRKSVCCRQTQTDKTGQWHKQSPQTRQKEIPWPGKTLILFPMIKTLIASGVAVSAAALASPALAEGNIYVNPEFNGSSYGDSYNGGVLNLDVGYELSEGGYSFYIQGGPALVMPNGADNEVEFAGKFGGSVAVSEKASVYGELSGITGDELSVGSKVGMKYSF